METKPKVYIETTIISYLTARPSRDLIVAAHQQLTHQWWERSSERYELLTSEIVSQEASSGDPKFASKRLELLATIKLLDIDRDAAEELAQRLISSGTLPAKAAADAMHLAIAVTSGLQYLLTWNCRHLANAAIRKQIDEVCLATGYPGVIICTPEELLEE